MRYQLEDRILHIAVDSLFVKTIQEFFDAYIPSRKVQHLLIQNKDITLDGNPVKREDDIVGLNLDINLYPEMHEYAQSDLQIRIVYEDEILLALNKPKDLLVHSDGSGEMTLQKMAEAYYADRPYIEALPLHRLDRETGGLNLFSKSPVFHPLLDQYMNEKRIRRSYLAFVKGRMEIGRIFTIDKPLGKDRHDARRRVVTSGGQKALTKVRCIGSRADYSVLLCTIETGRTHQIRVHLSAIGYPILNDPLYGEESSLCRRMGLFARSIELYHPLKEEMMEIEAELPADLEGLYQEALR